MGKYKLAQGAIEKDDPILETLNQIANELAEANRLKRLEIGMIADRNTAQFNFAYDENEIVEDRA